MGAESFRRIWLSMPNPCHHRDDMGILFLALKRGWRLPWRGSTHEVACPCFDLALVAIFMFKAFCLLWVDSPRTTA